jgi:hypothetical protein
MAVHAMIQIKGRAWLQNTAVDQSAVLHHGQRYVGPNEEYGLQFVVCVEHEGVGK